jgi:membrane protease YdiL (CAAX protease family)
VTEPLHVPDRPVHAAPLLLATAQSKNLVPEPLPLPQPAQTGYANPYDTRTEAPPVRDALLEAGAPLLGYLLVLPIVYLFFRRTWRELDVEAFEHKKATLARGEYDRRPLVLFVITAVVLTIQQYYDHDFYLFYVRPYLHEVELHPEKWPFGIGYHVSLHHYGELYALYWWAALRILGYTVVPLTLWKIFFPKDSILDMGLRTKGLLSHAWIYLLCLAVVVPAVFIVSKQPDFGNYYPFYKRCNRSWWDLGAWEIVYVLQFFGLEVFFRGFWLSGLRKSLGSGAIFAMCVPYCMIHYGKPYFETCGAVVAGIALGSVAMRTKSIYSGFFVHVTVALLMDALALAHKDALPTVMFPVFQDYPFPLPW